MKVINVIETKTGEIVHTVDVTNKSDSQIDRIERGMLINMHEEYHTSIKTN